MGLVGGWEGLREDACCGEGWKGVRGWEYCGGWEGLCEYGHDSETHSAANPIDLSECWRNPSKHLGDFEAAGWTLLECLDLRSSRFLSAVL